MSDDLIRRQAAIDVIFNDKIDSKSLEIMTALGNGNEALTVNMTCDRHMQLLSKLPSAQPEIIRCKDCKYHDEGYRRISVKWLPCMDMRPGSNWYCGSAERRTDDCR